MAGLKTKPTEVTVESFVNAQADQEVSDDCNTIIGLMQNVMGEAPKMWGSAIIGFGRYHYKYESGHEGDMCLIGFSPRKEKISFYILAGSENEDELLAKLGKYKRGKGCLYIKKLKDVDLNVLDELIKQSTEMLKKKRLV